MFNYVEWHSKSHKTITFHKKIRLYHGILVLYRQKHKYFFCLYEHTFIFYYVLLDTSASLFSLHKTGPSCHLILARSDFEIERQERKRERTLPKERSTQPVFPTQNKRDVPEKEINLFQILLICHCTVLLCNY